jgi:2'-5' RNA ligase
VSGLVLVIPELEALTADVRAAHDPAARYDMPPHITVLYPFVPMPKLRAEDRARLADVVGSIPALDLCFSRLARFPQVLWLAPDPEAPVLALAEAVAAAFPDCPPYGGQFATVIPHVTLAQAPEAVLDGLEPQMRLRFSQPVRARVDAVSLFATARRRWREVERFRLA